ncbi:hypothetical protein ASPBRDRAFT_205697 [Aspergillus brasiliensis CBS 101740]|uniref:BZIP domain-containing protein n=1 Tax=Aspergillus brasiliensis (strain CBS 101740 / IMI 381727 / IBT 21946) TaxID=767769 RepID=A0A1L9UNX8_ASPBC|nr:hypothetical protein ASPBRDRAFT_205697 [Aspergillus brasiliensis CBS 101740]
MPSSTTSADEKRQRKKLQNRINQRARRLRLKAGQHKEQTARPYSVHRWRVSEYETSPSSSSSTSSLTKHNSQTLSQTQTKHSPSLTPPTSSISINISPDHHLLHLITHNVFRALYSNKTLLYALSTSHIPGPNPNESIQIIHDGLIFPIYATLIPNSYPSPSPPIPTSLFPTPSQQNLIHCSWIDLVPFPRMRENLIAWEACFDHEEFVRDIVGGYIMEKWELRRGSDIDMGVMGMGRMLSVECDDDGDDDDEVTGNARNGWIVWGEPHCKESWEVTPGFLRKWGWVVQGCVEEVVECSNRWRVRRGEGVIRVVY